MKKVYRKLTTNLLIFLRFERCVKFLYSVARTKPMPVVVRNITTLKRKVKVKVKLKTKYGEKPEVVKYKANFKNFKNFTKYQAAKEYYLNKCLDEFPKKRKEDTVEYYVNEQKYQEKNEDRKLQKWGKKGVGCLFFAKK